MLKIKVAVIDISKLKIDHMTETGVKGVFHVQLLLPDFKCSIYSQSD